MCWMIVWICGGSETFARLSAVGSEPGSDFPTWPLSEHVLLTVLRCFSHAEVSDVCLL